MGRLSGRKLWGKPGGQSRLDFRASGKTSPCTSLVWAVEPQHRGSPRAPSALGTPPGRCRSGESECRRSGHLLSELFQEAIPVALQCIRWQTWKKQVETSPWMRGHPTGTATWGRSFPEMTTLLPGSECSRLSVLLQERIRSHLQSREENELGFRQLPLHVRS